MSIRPTKLRLDESVTAWIDRLRTGDRTAGELLHERYRDYLVRVARKNFASASTAVGDAEDLVQSVFCDLWRSASQGSLGQIEDRESFWWLLLTMARHKAISRIRRAKSQKRQGSRPTVQFSQLDDSKEVRNVHATPDLRTAHAELIRQFIEAQEHLFELLADDTERAIAAYKLEGHNHPAIAAKLNVSVRTVERKVAMIRERWVRDQVSSEEGLTQHDSQSG